MSEKKSQLLPLSVFFVFLVAIDQFVKFLIVRFIPLDEVGIQLGKGFLEIVHVRNLGVAFGLGGALPTLPRLIVAVGIPLCFLSYLMYYLFKEPSLGPLRRWAIIGIVGGGVGNLIDRIGRPQGVVDFVSITFQTSWGYLSLPTFNLADCFVVICGGALILASLYPSSAKSHQALATGEGKTPDEAQGACCGEEGGTEEG